VRIDRGNRSFLQITDRDVVPAAWYLLVLLTGLLMASTIRYPSFKELPVLKRGTPGAVCHGSLIG
jgi:hypothetical protein